MAWLYRARDRHRCKLPGYTGLDYKDVGSVWKCDVCGQNYALLDSQMEGLYWSPINAEDAVRRIEKGKKPRI